MLASRENGLLKSSGLRVMMSMVPAAPPSSSFASGVMCTTTWLTTSEGSIAKLTLRVPPLPRMNQSPEPTMWPLIVVNVSDGALPRMLARSASSKPPSAPAASAMFTPGSWAMVSATSLAGSLPMSTAETTSTCELAAFLVSSDNACAARTPTTWMVCNCWTVSFFFCVESVCAPVPACGWSLAVDWPCGEAFCAWAAAANNSAVAMLAESMLLRNFMTYPFSRSPGDGCRSTRKCVEQNALRRRAVSRGAADGTSHVGVGIPARRTHHAVTAVFDQAHGHALQEFAHAALAEEALHEAAVLQQLAHFRQDAAGQANAAIRHEGHGQVAHETAERGAEHVHRFEGIGVVARAGRGGHRFGGGQPRRPRAQPAQRRVQRQQTRPGKDPLIRHITTARRQVGQHFTFARIAGREVHLSRFAGEHAHAGRAGQAHRRTQSGAWPHHQRGAVSACAGTAQQQAVGVLHVIECVAERFEIIEQSNIIESQRLTQLRKADPPRQVVVDDGILDDLPRAGDHATPHRQGRVALDERGQQLRQSRKIRAGKLAIGQHFELALAIGGRAHQRDPRMGSAHVRGQERLRVKAGMLGQMIGGHTHPVLGRFERAPVWSWLTTLSICNAASRSDADKPPISSEDAASRDSPMLHRVKFIPSRGRCFSARGTCDTPHKTQI